MKRFLMMATLSAGLAVLGQEHAAAQHEGAAQHEDEGDPRAGLKWANFAILAVIMGWGLAKTLPGFFQSRSEEIAKGIAEASRLKAEAEAKAAAIEARMAGLSAEIETLRANAKREMQAEADRIKRETEAFLAKIHEGALSEIDAAANASRAQLKAYSAERALDLAEQKIRAGVGSGGQLVDRFIAELGKADRGKWGANN